VLIIWYYHTVVPIMKYLYYKDVALVPRHSSLRSRSDAETDITFLGHFFSLPVVPANMKDVINFENAKLLCEKKVFYIMHRWFSSEAVINVQKVTTFIMKMNEIGYLTSISVGIGPEWEELIENIINHDYIVDFITIDVAHADHDNVQNIIKKIKLNLPKTKLIVGNVATAEGCEYLIKLGVDAVKVGIGGGRIWS
jgi:GMP reductase